MRYQPLSFLSGVTRRTLCLPASLPGYLPLVRRLRSESLAIVMYHGVVPEPLTVPNWCQLDVHRFEDQIRFLASEYCPIPLGEALSRYRTRRALPPRAVAITFDDGFRNVFTTAYPVLQRYLVPFTVFLVTGFVDTFQPAWPDRLYHAVAHSHLHLLHFANRQWTLGTPQERAACYRDLSATLKQMPQATRVRCCESLHRDLGVNEVSESSPVATLRWSEIETMHSGGLASFGSHSHTHPILAQCSLESQRSELLQSRRVLLERLGAADAFAYPNGTRKDFTEATKALVAEAGYQCGLATIPGLNNRRTDVFEMRRVNVGAETTTRELQLRLLGW